MSSFLASGSRLISLAERSRSSFALLVSFLCAGHSLSLSFGDVVGGHQWNIQALSAGIRVGVRRWCSVPKKVFTSRREVTTLMTPSCTLPQKCSLPLNL
jgi:hypothetical protein